MPRRRPNRQQSETPIDTSVNDFWQEQIKVFGRRAFFVDTGGILKMLEADEAVIDFFDSLVGDQLITSTYVLTEVVRRIIKADHPNRFVGPRGERHSDLAIYVITEWIENHGIRVICPPEEVFNAAKAVFARNRGIGCDLVDVLSFVIVSGLEQNRIVSPDHHFRSLGLACYPSAIS
jgi:predicted nucleic acid-binding protein